MIQIKTLKLSFSFAGEGWDTPAEECSTEDFHAA